MEVERSKVVGDVVGEDALGMQMSKMEVDDAGEDEVVAEDKGSKGGRKQAPSSTPKPLRKWACASKAVVLKPAVIERTNSNASTVTTCDRCCHYNIKCIPTDGGAQCSNCKAKHYMCSLIPAKENSEGKGGSSATHCTLTATRGRMKAQEKKEAARKPKAFDRVTLSMFLSLPLTFGFTEVSLQILAIVKLFDSSMPLSLWGPFLRCVKVFIEVLTLFGGNWRHTIMSFSQSLASRSHVPNPSNSWWTPWWMHCLLMRRMKWS